MMTRFFLAATAAVLFEAPVHAQTTAAGDPVQTMDTPVMSMETWTDASIGVFFADPGMKQLRGAPEIEANFGTLSQSEQEQVRRECALLTNGDVSITAGTENDERGADTTMSNRTGTGQDGTSDGEDGVAAQGTGGASAEPAATDANAGAGSAKGGLSDQPGQAEGGLSDDQPPVAADNKSGGQTQGTVGTGTTAGIATATGTETMAGDTTATGTGTESGTGTGWASRDLPQQMWVDLCAVVETLPET